MYSYKFQMKLEPIIFSVSKVFVRGEISCHALNIFDQSIDTKATIKPGYDRKKNVK